MRYDLLGGLAIALSLLFTQGCLTPLPTPGPGPGPQPGPVVPDEFGLHQSVPPTMTGFRTDAFQLAAVADEYARALEYDGTLSQPKVATTAGLGDRMGEMTRYAFQGRPLATAAFSATVGAALSQAFEPGGEGQELTPALRTKAVKFFKALAAALRAVK